MRRNSGTRGTPRPVGCLYVLGFLSALLLVALCGSSSFYAGYPRHSAKPLRREVTPTPHHPAQDASPVPRADVDSFNIAMLDPQSSDEVHRLSIGGIGFVPQTSVRLTIWHAGERIAGPVETQADASTGYVEQDVGIPQAVGALWGETLHITLEGAGQTLETAYTLPPADMVQAQSPPSPQSTSTPVPATATPAAEPVSADPTVPVCTYTPTPTATPTDKPTATPTKPPTPYYTATPTPVPQHPHYPHWCGEYFNNVGRDGPPLLIRNDTNITFDWGKSSPAAGAVGKNWFSARWSRRLFLEEGLYDFLLSADDRASVWLNGEPFMSTQGKGNRAIEKSYYVHANEALNFEVDYIEYWGDASIHFRWEPAVDHDGWQGVYYDGIGLTGDPIGSEQYEGLTLRLDWRERAIPRGISPDTPFSARWSRRLQAPQQDGPYLVCVYADDGVRVWLDGEKFIDSWQNDAPRFDCRPKTLVRAPHHDLSIDYFHATGAPLLGFWVIPDLAHEWIGAFFDNPDLDGVPVQVRTAPQLMLTEESATPHRGYPPPPWSVRWKRNFMAPMGNNSFHVKANSRVRVRLNNITKLDAWSDEGKHAQAFTYITPRDSRIYVEVDYATLGNDVRLEFQHTPPPPTPTATPLPSATPTLTVTPSPTPTAIPQCCTPTPASP